MTTGGAKSRSRSRGRVAKRAASKSKSRASKSKSRSKSRSRSRRYGNPWLAFGKKNRPAVLKELKRKKNYPATQKGAMQLQQDCMVRLGEMWRAHKSKRGGCAGECS